MAGADTYKIIEDAVWRADDQELVELLRRVYVGGGFTDAELAATFRDRMLPHAHVTGDEKRWCSALDACHF